MPFNGSGSFTLAQAAFVPNTPISSLAVNSDLSDIATNGLSNAVAKDGQTTITGAFKGANGSVALPMYSFAADLDGGMYRIGANNIGISVNATKILDISTSGLTVTGTFSADSIQQSGAALLPAGIMFSYGGTAAPTGYLLCFGQSLLRADFPALFTAIGTAFGSADGSHFSLPDGRGRGLFGKDDMGGSAANRITTAGSGIDGLTLGASGGAQNVTILQANLPSATLTTTITDPGHDHQYADAFGLFDQGQAGTNGGSSGHLGNSSPGRIAANTTGITASTALGGSGTATNKMPPTLIVNIIIKT